MDAGADPSYTDDVDTVAPLAPQKEIDMEETKKRWAACGLKGTPTDRDVCFTRWCKYNNDGGKLTWTEFAANNGYWA